jgi:tRNA(Met) C34 N-acetyltransferase TmcA
VSLTAARGRGKSAALGLAMAGAVAFGYSNIFVTSPSPENLTTLFEFIFKGKSNRFTNNLNFSCFVFKLSSPF